MTDLEIAESVKAKPITEVAKKLGLTSEDLYLYGTKMAKVVNCVKEKKKGKLILVTAISPTPYGEGKTTVSIGLADGLNKLNENVCLSLRQPSLGPVFGFKGGATGGGYSQVIPMVDINLHFTGDFHAITAANNLISAAIYNHIEQGNQLQIDEVIFNRCLDMNDRTLRNISFLCNKKEVKDHFVLTAASEVMALFCLAESLDDLKGRLGNIIVGFTKEKIAVTVHDLKLEGSLTVLLKDAFYPNLVQTLEGTPALVHGGPFANIAHGCSSVKATKLALSLSDYVVTEAGFGSDLGAEKFLNLVCPKANLAPDTIVLVVTVRALIHHGYGILKKGLLNLEAHLDHLNCYHVPIIVAINQFQDDKEEDISIIKEFCKQRKIPCEVSSAFRDGGKGAVLLAKEVQELTNMKNEFQPLYKQDQSFEEKMNILSSKVYHAKEIKYTDLALEKLKLIKNLNLDHYPLCIAKTQYSISDDKEKLGYPKDNTIVIKDIVIHSGAEFLTVLLGNILTMPGLPKNPNYEKIDYINDKVIGIF